MSGWNFRYTTRDIVIIAVIAAITGVVNTGVGNVWYLLNTSLGPLGGALLQGAFMWAYILAMWLVRKPGTALLVGLIEAVVEILLGNAAGVGTLGWGLFQGLGIEAVMAICNYSKFGLISAICAGAAASLPIPVSLPDSRSTSPSSAASPNVFLTADSEHLVLRLELSEMGILRIMWAVRGRARTSMPTGKGGGAGVRSVA